MKKECDIVQDLLFGYVDNTLKEGSKELVEEHLKMCKKCLEILEDMRNDENNDIEEIEGLKKVNRKIRNKKIFGIIVSLLLIIFTLFNIMTFAYYSKVGGEMQVFLSDEISEEKKADIIDVVWSIDENATIVYESKEVALEKLKINLDGENEEKNRILEGYGDKNNPFPASYIIQTDLDKVDKIIEELSQIDEVKKITTSKNINPYVLFVVKIILKK